MTPKILLAFSILFSCSILLAQEKTQEVNSSELYFGQTPPGYTPQIFAPGFVSTHEFEFSGTFSKNGKEYFFTRRPTYQGNENRIYYSKLINGKWTKPILAPFANNTFEFEPVAFPKENKLYFYSERTESRDTRYDGDLWVTQKTNVGWSEPIHFQSPVNKQWCMSVSASMDGTLYFSSNYEGKRGIFKAEIKDGLYPDVEYLQGSINSDFYSHPYIAPDESYIIMDGQPSGRGKPELFISFKREDDSWSNPINMGAVINATKTEFGASISPDGKYLFFHRRVNEQGDIYWVDARIIKDLKPIDLDE